MNQKLMRVIEGRVLGVMRVYQYDLDWEIKKDIFEMIVELGYKDQRGEILVNYLFSSGFSCRVGYGKNFKIGVMFSFFL